MNKEDRVVAVAGWGKQERAHLEADWKRAWEARARAAQSGDYAEAERWHREATLLGAQLAAVDCGHCDGHQSTMHPN